VKSLKHFKSAIETASKETAAFMTAHVKAEANVNNWPSHVVSSLHVTHGKDGFRVKVHPDHRDEALDWEYGTPGRQPTAAMRRFNNNTRDSEQFFLGRLKAHLGE